MALMATPRHPQLLSRKADFSQFIPVMKTTDRPGDSVRTRRSFRSAAEEIIPVFALRKANKSGMVPRR
jgi:hypothetical protein